MTESTINKLRRYHQILQPEEHGGRWWINPNEHPAPTLADQKYLETEYLTQLEASSPHLLDEARELISFAGKERG